MRAKLSNHLVPNTMQENKYSNDNNKQTQYILTREFWGG